MLPTLGAGTGAPDRHRVDSRTAANPNSCSHPMPPGPAAGRDTPSPNDGPLARLPPSPDASAAQRTLQDCYTACQQDVPALLLEMVGRHGAHDSGVDDDDIGFHLSRHGRVLAGHD